MRRPFSLAGVDLPRRGPGARELGLALPPARMPRVRDRRPLKRWTYLGAYGPDLMLCAGDARVGPLPIRWWAVAEPGRPLAERTTVVASGGVELDRERLHVSARGVRIELQLEAAGEPMEVASPSGDSYIWTEKLPVTARGTVEVGGRRHDVDLPGLVDDSAGYHARETAWKWSAGVGSTDDGRALAWNLVTGVHDAPRESERTVWVDGVPAEVGEVEFEPDLSALRSAAANGGASLEFSEWSARESRLNVGVFRNVYRQPFGTFAGELPGGLRLASGYGVMEEHDARW